MSDYTQLEKLKDENDKLKREVWDWKQAAKREAVAGVVLGGVVMFIIGIIVGSVI